ncbi:acetoin utilization protein AcuC [Actinopolymorpha sp. B11F2]|uniref:acetoin utilization protein AcuC n=1 Tax=Actinopolymorpha sp. B11F2 TaxID=3160862 RepID=UPI0032E3C847
MTGSARLVYDEDLTAYNFGPMHPLAPIRVKLTVALSSDLGLIHGPGSSGGGHGAGQGADGLRRVAAPVASEDLLARVHAPAYIEAVKRSSVNPALTDLDAGLGTSDNPTFTGMHEASAHIAGASVEAARIVWTGEALHAVNVAGGLHHAMPAAASGFCVYNDPALAIAWLLDAGCPRVAYLDLDVHHGDGVQEMFYDDPRVLTISLHETPRTLFPWFSGFPTETGGPDAEGSAVNVALPGGTDDAGWLRAFHAVVPPLLRAFAPTVLVSQHGCDSHRLDPLAHLALSVDGQRAAALAVHELAHELCEGRWVATGGGGYALVDVVPRTWSHLLAIAGGSPLDPNTETPATWREQVAVECRRTAPVVMTDGESASYSDWSAGYDPGDEIDRTIRTTRRAVFPLHGLDADHP